MKRHFFQWLHAGYFAKRCQGLHRYQFANFLESDTDTIATMAGALLGALPNQSVPDDTIQDAEYIEFEANRLFEISQRIDIKVFRILIYCIGNLLRLRWTASELIRYYELAGFGEISPLSEEFPGTQNGTVWQWFQLGFGQSILCKRRISPKNYSNRVLSIRCRNWWSKLVKRRFCE